MNTATYHGTWLYSEPPPLEWHSGDCDDTALLDRRAWHLAHKCENIVDMVVRAKHFATQCHHGIFRKYEKPPVPYIVHPERVANRTAKLPGATPAMVAAAWLHDVREDCGVSNEVLTFLFPEDPLVAAYVDDLTNRFKDAIDPKTGALLRRAERKRLEFERIKTVRPETKRIKLVDRIDNLGDMQTNGDWGFVLKYAGEGEQLSQVAGDADPILNKELLAVIAAIRATKK